MTARSSLQVARMAQALSSLPQPPSEPLRIGRLVAFDGLMLEATGLSLPVGATVTVRGFDGSDCAGEVVGFRGDRSMIMALGADGQPMAGARVEPDSTGAMVDAGPALLGRVVDALGNPLDGLGPIVGATRWPLYGQPVNPLRRSQLTQPFDVGVRAINGLLTAAVGQRIAIVAGSGVGKSVLMGQILAGAKADAIVVGLVGERSREVSDFLVKQLPPEVRCRAVVVAVPADHAPLLRLRAAMRATAIAEEMRARGMNVLLLIDSLTRVAHAQREIGLSLGEPPTAKGYPPSALGLLPRLIERAGVDGDTGGSITALYTVLADGDDNDDPIVDTARAIVDGHIILSRTLAEAGVYPAIDIGRSLSRVMPDVVSPHHLRSAMAYRRLWSAYETNRDLILMGAYAHGSDPLIDEAIERRSDLLAYLGQAQDDQVPLDDSLAALTAMVPA
jgi:flagellum-specific ATP synthase